MMNTTSKSYTTTRTSSRIIFTILMDFLRFFLRLLEVGFKSPPMDCHFWKCRNNVGYKSTPRTPILVTFGQPLGPRIGQNLYPTLCGIIGGPVTSLRLHGHVMKFINARVLGADSSPHLLPVMDDTPNASVHEALQDSLDAVRICAPKPGSFQHSINPVAAGISAFIHVDSVASTPNPGASDYSSICGP
jgi:hypothetical protein